MNHYHTELYKFNIVSTVGIVSPNIESYIARKPPQYISELINIHPNQIFPVSL